MIGVTMDTDRKTVLMIEDNFAAMTAQSTLLESMNYDVIQAQTGSEGIALCASISETRKCVKLLSGGMENINGQRQQSIN